MLISFLSLPLSLSLLTHCAAMVSLLNAARVSAGLRSVGWLNPSLYRYAALFSQDVTDGHNKCTLSGQCCDSGFAAGTGWDPVTGLGSVNLTRFRDNRGVPCNRHSCCREGVGNMHSPRGRGGNSSSDD